MTPLPDNTLGLHELAAHTTADDVRRLVRPDITFRDFFEDQAADTEARRAKRAAFFGSLPRENAGELEEEISFRTNGRGEPLVLDFRESEQVASSDELVNPERKGGRGKSPEQPAAGGRFDTRAALAWEFKFSAAVIATLVLIAVIATVVHPGVRS